MLIKRCLDITLSCLILLLLGPAFLAIAVAVWLDSGSPILFRQVRVGLGFRRFKIVKFRTMRIQVGGPAVTVRGDSRITRVGRILRVTKTDELPQFWNVLRGEMSVVGPRPEVPEYVELYKERYRGILSVRPGITDLASIYFRDEETVLSRSADPLFEYSQHVLPVKLDLAEKYIRDRGFVNDLKIIARTALVTLSGSILAQEK
jgi:lipopolysaccharide/colanic/teichoic acid biosynthesis glycosyltransferase